MAMAPTNGHMSCRINLPLSGCPLTYRLMLGWMLYTSLWIVTPVSGSTGYATAPVHTTSGSLRSSPAKCCPNTDATEGPRITMDLVASIRGRRMFVEICVVVCQFTRWDVWPMCVCLLGRVSPKPIGLPTNAYITATTTSYCL